LYSAASEALVAGNVSISWMLQ